MKDSSSRIVIVGLVVLGALLVTAAVVALTKTSSILPQPSTASTPGPSATP